MYTTYVCTHIYAHANNEEKINSQRITANGKILEDSIQKNIFGLGVGKDFWFCHYTRKGLYTL